MSTIYLVSPSLGYFSKTSHPPLLSIALIDTSWSIIGIASSGKSLAAAISVALRL